MMAINYKIYSLKVKDAFERIKNGTLTIDTTYQRRKIWSDKDKVRLIETILLGLIMPELYFWDSDTNPDSGITVTHIVDGQQRIDAMVDFIDNKFKLTEDYLTDIKKVSVDVIGKYFNELQDKFKKEIWKHELTIVQINENNKEEIKRMFYRLNLTNYSLNEQEKRHSKSWGKFANLTQEISDNKFWLEFAIFNKGDFRRMKDEEFCSSLILLSRKGIIDQTVQKPINDAYEDLKDDYPEYDEDKNRILEWINIIRQLINKENLSFCQKKTQIYTIFCFANYMERNEIPITDELKERFNQFIAKYNLFKNDLNNTINNVEEDAIRRYKLAASEGVNKLRNRKLRFEILKDYVLNNI